MAAHNFSIEFETRIRPSFRWVLAVALTAQDFGIVLPEGSITWLAKRGAEIRRAGQRKWIKAK